MSDKLNERFSFPWEVLEERLGFSLNHTLQGYDTIVSLRDLRSIDHGAKGVLLDGIHRSYLCKSAASLFS